MSKNPTHDWNSSIVLDDVDFQEHEARQFRDLLYGTSKQEDEASFSPFNVGDKSEGLVPIAEFADSGELILGANTEVFLDAAEGSDGQIVLSKEKARKFRQWEHIVNHCTEGSIVHGKVIRKVKGGLMVDIGMEAFLPGSQIDNKRIKNLDDFVGKSYEFKILKINIERKNIVVSRRELLEEERVSKKAELIEHIEEGTV